MIKQFYVDNYKCLRNFTLPLGQGLHILAGPNGAGKTSVCEAMEMAFSLVDKHPMDIMNAIDDSIIKNKWGNKGRISFKLNISIRVLNKETMEIGKKVLVWSITIAKEKDWAVIEESVEDYVAGTKLLSRKSREITVLNRETNENEKEFKELPSYLGTIAEENRGKYPELWALKNQIKFRYVPFLSPFYLRRSTRETELGPHGENFAAYLYYLRKNMPFAFEKAIARTKEFFPSIESILPKRKEYGWTEFRIKQKMSGVEGHVSFRQSQVSDGLLRLLAIATMPYSVPGLKYLAFEEPENGMDPRLLGNTLDLLRSFENEGIQVIVTTHSPVLLNYAKPEEVVVLHSRGIEGPEAMPFKDLSKGMENFEYLDIGDVLFNFENEQLFKSNIPSPIPGK